jgi:hypothetical protein
MTDRFEQLVSDCRGLVQSQRVMRALDAVPATADLMHWMDILVHFRANLSLVMRYESADSADRVLLTLDNAICALEDAAIEQSTFDDDEQGGNTYDDSLFAAERRALLRGFGG